VKFARKSIEKSFKGDVFEFPSEFSEKRGVFVTLLNFPSHELRGCIGFPYSEIPLGKAVMEGAKAAAFCDPRFPPLEKSEIDKVVIEVSVLTKPEEIKCSKAVLSKNVKIGDDGLIVNFQGRGGLLLPQVPIEWKWNSEQFIKQTCIKAGLSPETWKSDECRFYKFQAQIFAEEKPKGRVVERKIKC
jgi:uncharacterized protein (TIGR00296 family)